MNVLLDTTVLIRIVLDTPLKRTGREAFMAAELHGGLYVSAISAWELCLLEKTGRTSKLIGGNGGQFFRDVITKTGINVVPLDEQIAVESRRLPGDFHNDPADRFLVATARLRNLPLMTSDRPILDYGDLGHVQTIRC
jgi:PIN domain nuclease of toxin-antitoxin system